MTIGDLQHVLRMAGIELTPDQLADALWLAVLTSERAPGRPQGPVPAVTTDTQGQGRPASAAQARPTGHDHDGDAAGKADVSLYLPGPTLRQSASAFLGQPVRVPVGRGLPDPLGLARALRPLRHQLASRNHLILDEGATADRSAEQRMWWPVYVPAPQRVIDLALVVDTSASMVLWDSMIAELRLLCQRLGVFRDVRVRYLAADVTSGQLRPVLRGESPVSSAREPKELLDPSGRRLILVVTDGVHPHWHSGLFQKALAQWASAGSVAIIQPLPQRLWDRTGLHSVVTEFRGADAVDRSRLVHPQYQPAGNEQPDPRLSSVIPLLEVTPASFARWAKLAVGAGSATVLAAAVLVRGDSADGNGQRLDVPAGGHGRAPADPATRVRDFRASVSPAAYRLAGLFSAVAPLSLLVMRLVQEVMGTDTSSSELAEVFLSGLLRRVTPIGEPVSNTDAQYDFADGTREVLMSTITRAQAIDLLRMMGAHLTGRHDNGRSFAAVALSASAEDIRDAAAMSAPFATVATMVLERVAPSGVWMSGMAYRPDPQQSQTSTMPAGNQIAAALAGRSSQRAFADALARSWEHLADCWSALVTSAADLGSAAVRARPQDGSAAGVFADLAELAPGGGWQRESAAEVTVLIAETSGLVRVLHRRMYRDTVSLAVIGQTGAGKSTLLRKLSGLTDDVIPSNRYTATTATPSRIFHEPGAGAGRAVLYLHTWESFRAEVLEPLHQQAMVPGSAPMSVTEFRRFPEYRDNEVAAIRAGTERYRRRLRLAQDSLLSYQDLLRGGTQEITLHRLRPFVAYPADGDPQAGYRPYHAVRSVDIFCEFPEVGPVALGLVDMPGTGEAGLDVHGRFLTDLRNNADVLYLVKRPERAPVTDPDWDMYQLADDAAAGVRRSDFAHQLINRDASVPTEFFESALARATDNGKRLGIDVRVCDLESSSPTDVTQAVLSPVLAMLAERLAYMDRDAAEKVLVDVTGITGQVQSLVSHLARWIETWLGSLPDEEDLLRRRAWELKNEVSWELMRIRDEYDNLYRSGAPIAELDQEIERAGREMREWLDGGLGAGSRQEWMRTFRAAEEASGLGAELDERYNRARNQVVLVFGRIDSALARSVERLWGDVADALRRKLTEAVVPAGTDNHAILSTFADNAGRCEARAISDAANRLLNLPSDYGSIFLRAGRPLIGKILWSSTESGPELRPGVPGDLEAGRAPGATGEAPEATGEFARASRWFSQLTSTVEQVTSELERELHVEAQRTLRVLAQCQGL